MHSQFGEDGVIERIVADLGIERGSFFEFGIGPAAEASPPDAGLEGNFVLLQENGWTGVFLDGGTAPRRICDVRQRIRHRAEHQPALLQACCTSWTWDAISIDVDGQDIWIWLALQHRPKLVVIEYNGALGTEHSMCVPFDVDFRWDYTRYQGASIRALHKVGVAKSYVLVCANGVNAFFVRDDLVANPDDFPYDRIATPHPEIHGADLSQRPWTII